VAVACSDPVSPDASVAAIEIVSGNAVTFDYGSTVSIVPTVRVLDAVGNPVRGARVVFDALQNSEVAGAGETTARSDANGIASAPGWKPRYVGSNTLEARAGTTTVTFEARGRCAPTATVTLGQEVSSSVTESSCRYYDDCLMFCSDAWHQRFVFAVATQQGVRLRGSAAEPGNPGFVTVFDSRQQAIAYGIFDAAFSAIIPAGTYEIEVLSSVVPLSYVLDVQTTQESLGCGPVYLDRGVTTAQHLDEADCRAEVGVSRFVDEFILLLERGEGATVHMSSAQFGSRLEAHALSFIVIDGEIFPPPMVAIGSGDVRVVIPACELDACSFSIRASTSESLKTGGYTLTVE
jgi:hypothetical protein